MFVYPIYSKCSFSRESMSQKERDGVGDRGCKAGSKLTAVTLTWGSNSQTVRSRLEQKSDASPTEPLGAPVSF